MLSLEVSTVEHCEKQILDYCPQDAKFQDLIKQNNPQVMENCWKYSPHLPQSKQGIRKNHGFQNGRLDKST